jgi:cytochrome c biogenesis protein CcmG/thiol:disulfide interchange protein DsbE
VKRDPVIVLVIAMVVSVMLVLGISMSKRSKSADSGPAAKGQAAPDFAMKSLDGKTVRLSDFRGKAVLLNFWATWCEPCKIEMPWFVELQKSYGQNGLQVLGVAMDDASKEDIAKFAKEMGVNYPVLVDNESIREEVGNSYGGVQFLPTTLYIDRDGKVVDKVFGLKGRSEIEDDVKKALGDAKVAQAR